MRYLPLRFTMLICMLLVQLYACANEANEALLRKHVTKLTSGEGYRNHSDTVALNRAAQYIYKQFAELTKETYTQTFTVKSVKYYNVFASFGPVNAPRIIIGAHYDVCGDRPGADDNASGVAGLLELARMFSETDKSKWEMRVTWWRTAWKSHHTLAARIWAVLYTLLRYTIIKLPLWAWYAWR